MDQIIDGIVAAIGIDPMALMGFLALISLVSQLIGKAIPDEATGFLGLVRKIAKVIGLYVTNRTGNSGFSTAEIHKR